MLSIDISADSWFGVVVENESFKVDTPYNDDAIFDRSTAATPHRDERPYPILCTTSAPTHWCDRHHRTPGGCGIPETGSVDGRRYDILNDSLGMIVQ